MRSTLSTTRRAGTRARGAALAVGLVLLLVLTVLAVASVRTARRDARRSADLASETEAIEAAERAIGLAIRRTVPNPRAPLVTVPVAQSGSSGGYTVEFNPANAVTAVAGGFSLGEGVGFTAFHVDVIATGTAPGGTSVSVTQSYYIVGPPGG
ncbi:MAG TPA: PilX N-terminal domain-containing pilus assembly protein [Steroidobacteraceae bacterium]|nr:PilX N-terminal domain-containing pilus assembly protein [Steroidobacteraceae bacterium]